MIKGCPMFVAAWSPEFTPEQPQLTSVVVSVELRGVTYLLFNQQSLSKIATAIGRPVSLAPETERKENFEVAKVWIHVNMLESLPEKIVSGFSNGREAEISVSYPWLPDKCSQCGKFGHKHQLCPSAGQLWRPIDPSAGVCRSVSPLGRPKSRESQGRRRFRPRRSERARRRDLSGGRRDWVERAIDNLSPHSNTAQHKKECQAPESEGMLADPEIVSKVVSLDRNSAFSTVHVFHEDDGYAPCKADDSGDPFLMVSNRKRSRKATKD
ncbi:hypothetical protein F2Q70_00020249 [Brassica cretica]|uniref:CCHC-type domain-containing protein n=1 Tax=Brassica cretica TaxID=69181 RepID=A0A8S9GIV3_BRACR|nr:hypothetical protein F2Q70_00020249 [Brassica cretica]